MIRRPPRSTPLYSSAASDVYKRQPFKRALRELNVTLERIREAAAFCGAEMLLAAPIQGSTHLDLREQHARLLSTLNADVYPIGAVVPLMESYRYADLSLSL